LIDGGPSGVRFFGRRRGQEPRPTLEIHQLPEGRTFLESWYASLSDPRGAQERVLKGLLAGYGRTSNGRRFSASKVSNIEDFRRSFPDSTYDSFIPMLDAVAEGRHEELLPEPARGWAMTRGTTGLPKLFPLTDEHLRQIFVCGSRAVLNYALKEDGSDILSRPILNLGYPSNIGQLKDVDLEIGNYGYSSGTYARLLPGFGSFRLVPKQEEIDAEGGGWKQRFEFIYERARGLEIGSLIGVTQIMISFAKYLHRYHGLYPKKLWDIDVLFCTSVPKIHVKYAPYLKRLYGDADVVEIYSATEGVYGQQLDQYPYISPNYDAYLFEVQTKGGFKMLHELKRGEWGSIVVSSCILPRYRIGDLIESHGRNYFRIIGRASNATIYEHRLYRALARWLT
jgi:hypothetical protein